MTPVTKSHNKSWVVYVSTFPPRECGIGTFSQDLTDAFDELYDPREESRVIAINADGPLGYNYSKKVILQINENIQDDYVAAARKVNELPQVKLVNVQHEYGIFGGGYGSYIIDFMKEVEKPIVLTMHTVLPGPNEHLKETTIALCEQADTIVVMTKLSKEILIKFYGVQDEKVKIIPHGIHPLPYSTSKEMKASLGFTNKTVISTFGLLSKGKGIEYAIEALPEVVKKHPDVVYLVIGATHPGVLKKEGEAYRNMLVERVDKLGLNQHVVFYNKYFEVQELLQFLQATDVYMALPLDPNQAVSGTLSYALGTGRPVIATKFAQAKEDVTDEVGLLVDFKDSPAISTALLTMLSNEAKRVKMGEKAYFRTRKMEWRNVVISYMREYINLVPQLQKREKNLPKLKLRHMIKLTDSFGMFQFAKFTKPDPQWGYTLDDNARALIAMCMYYEKLGGEIALKLVRVYLNFIEYTAQKGGGFHNYVNADKTFRTERNETEDLSDANARCFYALAYAAASGKLPFDIRHKAATLFKANLDLKKQINSPRSMSFYIKAFDLWGSVDECKEIDERMKQYSDYLIKLFHENSAQNWQWFEDSMTYSNGIMPEALLIAYKKTKKKEYFDVAKSSLDFLINYSFHDEICVPIGQNGWFRRGGQKHIHDQQPEEVSALIETSQLMYEMTKDEKYKKYMFLAFNWFLGNNLLEQVVYDQETGGCYDGVGETEVNLNQGAESTVVYLIARLLLQ